MLCSFNFRMVERESTVFLANRLTDFVMISEDYHLHTLRHFYATYLLQEGTSKQVAASLLGHADTAFLERTYCHPQDVAKRQAANLMQDLLNNQNPCYVAFMKNKNRKAKKAG